KHRVSPAIDQAEAEIAGLEKERQRRAGLVFGPPQFASGGYVDATRNMWTARPGELCAMLHHGEFVVNPQATSANRPTLESINSGRRVGNEHHVIHIHAWDARSVQEWLRAGGGDELADYFADRKKLGRK